MCCVKVELRAINKLKVILMQRENACCKYLNLPFEHHFIHSSQHELEKYVHSGGGGKG